MIVEIGKLGERGKVVKLIEGDLFGARPEAIGHGVNCMGVMGAGIAKIFKREYPAMFAAYADSCRDGELVPGGVLIWTEADGQVVYNLATQFFPGAQARLEYVESSVRMACENAVAKGVKRINLPKIGCGIGGLQWEEVQEVLELVENDFPVEIVVYSLN